jgi:chemotaxis protein CheZ
MDAINAVESECAAPGLSPHDVFQRLGALTRSLHDALRQLGYDKCVEDAVGMLPDARERLDYIANLTGKAAERVLGAAERAKAAQASVLAGSRGLGQSWDRLLAEDASPAALKALGGETRAYLSAASATAGEVDRELTEIMLAQDFHDLTGQVIQRITKLAQVLEDQLVKLLLDATPPGRRRDVPEGPLAGPVISAAGRDDVVTSQTEVDEMLASLGF